VKDIGAGTSCSAQSVCQQCLAMKGEYDTPANAKD